MSSVTSAFLTAQPAVDLSSSSFSSNASFAFIASRTLHDPSAKVPAPQFEILPCLICYRNAGWSLHANGTLSCDYCFSFTSIAILMARLRYRSSIQNQTITDSTIAALPAARQGLPIAQIPHNLANIVGVGTHATPALPIVTATVMTQAGDRPNPKASTAPVSEPSSAATIPSTVSPTRILSTTSTTPQSAIISNTQSQTVTDTSTSNRTTLRKRSAPFHIIAVTDSQTENKADIPSLARANGAIGKSNTLSDTMNNNTMNNNSPSVSSSSSPSYLEAVADSHTVSEIMDSSLSNISTSLPLPFLPQTGQFSQSKRLKKNNSIMSNVSASDFSESLSVNECQPNPKGSGNMRAIPIYHFLNRPAVAKQTYGRVSDDTSYVAFDRAALLDTLYLHRYEALEAKVIHFFLRIFHTDTDASSSSSSSLFS